MVVFSQPSTRYLVDRLKEVCLGERLHVANDALLMLCKSSENDVRTCLNTLQYMQNIKDAVRITPEIIQKVGIGGKDMTKTVFDVWSKVFTLPRRRGTVETAAARISAAQTRAAELTHAVMSVYVWWRCRCRCGRCGTRPVHCAFFFFWVPAHRRDGPLMLAGLHHNFPQSKYQDPTFSKTVECADWLCFADRCMVRPRRQPSVCFSFAFSLPPFAVVV